MFSDIRYALRQLAKAPGFSAVVILSLALGIGANATVLSWLQSLVRKPLPGVESQEQIVVLVSNQGSGCISLPDQRDFAQLGDIFAGTMVAMPTHACLTIDRHPQWIDAQVVSANFFELLGVRPLLGRTFRADEDRKPGGNPVLVIGESLWRRQFGADPEIVGRVVELNQHAFTVVGVVPKSFHGSNPPSLIEAWAPASMIWEVRNQGTYFLTNRQARGWHNLARLKPGVTLAQANAAVATCDARLATEYPKESRDIHHRVVPVAECPWGAQKVLGPALWLLLAVSVGVQLIVTANVANLMLARAVGRRKEIAIRLATGCSQLRLLRQFFAESALFVLLGGGLGLFLASWAVDSIFLMLPKGMVNGPQLAFHLDATTVVVTMLVAAATAIVFGLTPALQSLRLDLIGTLKEGGRASTGAGLHHRLRSALVVTEVALALVLLIGAGLCLRGLQQAQKVDIGFNPAGVLLGEMRIGMHGYTPETGKVFYRQLRERLAAHPEVEEAALASWFPLGLGGCKGWDVHIEGRENQPGEDLTHEFAIVSPRYFATLQIPLVTGRDFTEADDASAPGAAIVNEEFARHFWPGQDALGRRFRTGGVWRTVVGVAKTGKYNHLAEAPHRFFYLAYQQGVPDLDLDVCVRTKADPSGFVPALRQTLRDLDPGVEMRRALPLADYSSMALFSQRMAALFLTLLSAIALGLAAMGIYAVIAYMVSQRTQEFGVRQALGASQGDVLRLVLRQGLVLAATGIGIGLGLAALLTRLLASLLYGVSPFDPVTFGGISLLLVGVAVLATLLPARRATRVDPMIALRSE